MVSAGPITYDFTGTLSQPVAGTQTFSGSFTINGNPTVAPGSPGVTENGSDVALTLNLGGQVIQYVNTARDPSYVTADAVIVPTWLEVPPGSPTIGFSVSGGNNGGTYPFSMRFSSPGGADQLTNWGSLSFPLYTSLVYLSDSPGGPLGVEGVITSIEAVSAPEPSNLISFVVLGTLAWAYQNSGKGDRNRKGS
jgi:hypothetical protein